MIHEIVLKPENRYGRFFLSTEAPDDEPPVKSNTKVIEVKPNNRRRYDFTANATDSEDLEVPETGEEPEMDTEVDTGEDFTADTSDVSEEPVTDDTGENQETPEQETNPMDETPQDTTAPVIEDPENPDANADANVDTGDDFTDDTSDNSTELDTDDTGDTDVDTGEDFTADTGGDTGADAVATDASPQDGTDQKKGPGIEYDSTRKYALFLNYESLINACNNYIAKLENNIGDDINVNKVIKTGVGKIREVKELAFDYIIMKFEASSYIQSLLFYQNLIVMIQAIFDMLKKSLKLAKTEK